MQFVNQKLVYRETSSTTTVACLCFKADNYTFNTDKSRYYCGKHLYFLEAKAEA